MLVLRHLTKTYHGARPVVPSVRDVSLEIPRGSFFTLLGPSGCGKTTILHCIAGLETPDSGDIEIDGVAVFSGASGHNEPPHRRRLGMVFQSYAIWPHMSVFDNVAFPLQQQRPRLASRDIKARVMTALSLVRLEAVADKLAPFLSGGQQQRVALARALVHEPRLLLLDEPLSNLDAKLREEMRVELGRLVRHLGITTIFVTHDQAEALTMSDRIALIDAGQVVQQGAPHDIYYRPNSTFAARFVCGGNIVPGTVLSAPDTRQQAEIDTPFGRIACGLPTGINAGDDVNLIVRPDSLQIRDSATPADGRPNFFHVDISDVSFMGDFFEGIAHSGSTALRVRLDPHVQIRTPHAAVVEVIAQRCVVLPRKE